VRILEAVPATRLAGEGLAVDGTPLRAAGVTATAQTGRVSVGGRQSGSEVRVRGQRGVVVDGRWFPGGVALIPRGDGTLDVVNVVPIEAYVERAVASEIYADWPREALKAQAVVARTYALYERRRRVDEPFHLESGVVSQRYDARRVALAIRQATAETLGEYLDFEGEPILAAFHSSAGGKTASSAEVWGAPRVYLSVVPSPDDAAPDYFWSFDIELSDLRAALRERGFAPGDSGGVTILERTESGRVAQIEVSGAVLSGRELRQALGGRALRSTLFDVRAEEGGVRFVGSGSGHGVGLSQWGARELARKGKTYRQILQHYYPRSEIRRLGTPDGSRAGLGTRS
jgi:stage II sporulation protein D